MTKPVDPLTQRPARERLLASFDEYERESRMVGVWQPSDRVVRDAVLLALPQIEQEAVAAVRHTPCMYCGASVCGVEAQVEHVGCAIGADNNEWERVTVAYARASLLAELREAVLSVPRTGEYVGLRGLHEQVDLAAVLALLSTPEPGGPR